MQASILSQEQRAIFAVDLDDTLIKTDLLFERLLNLCLHSPASLFLIPWYLCRGPLAFKKWLKSRVEINYENLPYRKDVLDRVKSARQRGEKTILISASLQEDVDRIASFLKVFDESVGSRDKNLKGISKVEYLEHKYPHAVKTYVGDSGSDISVWNRSQKAIVVNPGWWLRSEFSKTQISPEIICDQKGLGSLIFKQLRVHQWSKNILVFIPVFLAHRFDEWTPWIRSTQAFFAFSMMASAVYVFNDLCDLNNDRLQESKKHRPLASGQLPLRVGFFLVPICLLAAIAILLSLPTETWIVFAAYLCMNGIYSFWVKEWLAIDVVFLSVFYTLRILAGGAASQTWVSEWLLSFSVFFFFGLAMVKRYSELKKQSLMSLVSGTSRGRRAYEAQDLMTIMVMGISTSIVSILVLALYLNSGEVQKLYQHPRILWLVTPMLLFWLNRLWLLGARGQVNEDPVIFAIKDKQTWFVAAAILGIIAEAIWG